MATKKKSVFLIYNNSFMLAAAKQKICFKNSWNKRITVLIINNFHCNLNTNIIFFLKYSQNTKMNNNRNENNFISYGKMQSKLLKIFCLSTLLTKQWKPFIGNVCWTTNSWFCIRKKGNSYYFPSFFFIFFSSSFVLRFIRI